MKKVKEGFIGQRMIVLPPNVKKVIAANQLIKNFYTTAIGYYPKAVYHHRERKFGSSQYILIYCVDGVGKVDISDKAYTLKPNTFIILPKNVAHRYKSSNTNPWSIHWVHFSGDSADVIYHRSTDQGEPHVHNIPYNQNRVIIFEQLCAMLEHSFEEKQLEVANIYLQQFISSLVYYRELNPIVYDVDAVSNSIAYMKKNIDQKLTLQDLALQVSISAPHYSRLFRQKTGSSPVSYFNLLKIQASCQYLYFSDHSVKEIATLMGFDDQYYFSRLFKKLMGIPPLSYRKTHKR